jgi:hypothetical protein
MRQTQVSHRDFEKSVTRSFYVLKKLLDFDVLSSHIENATGCQSHPHADNCSPISKHGLSWQIELTLQVSSQSTPNIERQDM